MYKISTDIYVKAIMNYVNALYPVISRFNKRKLKSKSFLMM